MAHIIGVIQARMSSSRFPKKMAAELIGYPIIDWVIRRTLISKNIDKLFVATSKNSENDFIVERANFYNVPIYRGSENNVLSRFESISKIESPDLIIRICADNPLISPIEIDRLIEFSLKNKPDYAFNHIPALDNGYVDGSGTEAFTFNTLKRIVNNATSDEHKEHVTKYIWENINEFNVKYPIAPKELNFPNFSLDVDTIDDFERIKNLISKISNWKYPEDIDLMYLPEWLNRLEKNA